MFAAFGSIGAGAALTLSGVSDLLFPVPDIPDFSNEEEFNQFYDILKVTLPTTFRVNPAYPNYQAFLSMLKNDKYMNDNFFSEKISDDLKEKEGLVESEDFNLAAVDWYPDS